MSNIPITSTYIHKFTNPKGSDIGLPLRNDQDLSFGAASVSNASQDANDLIYEYLNNIANQYCSDLGMGYEYGYVTEYSMIGIPDYHYNIDNNGYTINKTHSI